MLQIKFQEIIFLDIFNVNIIYMYFASAVTMNVVLKTCCVHSWRSSKKMEYPDIFRCSQQQQKNRWNMLPKLYLAYTVQGHRFHYNVCNYGFSLSYFVFIFVIFSRTFIMLVNLSVYFSYISELISMFFLYSRYLFGFFSYIRVFSPYCFLIFMIWKKGWNQLKRGS